MRAAAPTNRRRASEKTLANGEPFSNRGLQVKRIVEFALEVFVLFAVNIESLNNPVR